MRFLRLVMLALLLLYISPLGRLMEQLETEGKARRIHISPFRRLMERLETEGKARRIPDLCLYTMTEADARAVAAPLPGWLMAW